VADQKRILVVDDEPSVTQLLRMLLQLQGHRVTSTERSEEAAQWLQDLSLPFDLMVSDIRMTPVDGLELLRIARKMRPTMPVILVTAYDSEGIRAEACQNGVFEFLTKPFPVAALRTAVTRALQSASAPQSNA
jgi:DNA-binding NtrC family response regulator